MKILIAGLTTGYQFARLKEEATKRGHNLTGCQSDDLVISEKNNKLTASVLNEDLNSYDLIYSFIVKRRWEWNSAFSNISEKTKIIRGGIYSPLDEYFLEFKNNIPWPKTAVVYSSKNAIHETQGFKFPIIIKNGLVHQGKGVFMANSEKEVLEISKKIKKSASPIVIREFIPNNGDIRVFTINYKAIAAITRRSGKKSEFRNNISLGGVAENFDLSDNPNILKIAEEASKAAKVEIAGLDIVIHKDTGKPYVLEINTCPQLKGIETNSGVNVALAIIKYFEKII